MAGRVEAMAKHVEGLVSSCEAPVAWVGSWYSFAGIVRRWFEAGSMSEAEMRQEFTGPELRQFGRMVKNDQELFWLLDIVKLCEWLDSIEATREAGRTVQGSR